MDLLFRELVRVVAADFPQYMERSFDVAELYQTIIPFRHHRRELGFDSNARFEMALLRLLSGERGYLLVSDRMRDSLSLELEASRPDPGAFRSFADEQVAVDPAAARRFGPWGEASRTQTAEPGTERAGRRRMGDACPYCKRSLPLGRTVTFCPHCGQNLSIVHCPACDAELESKWKYCVQCGRPSENG